MAGLGAGRIFPNLGRALMTPNLGASLIAANLGRPLMPNLGRPLIGRQATRTSTVQARVNAWRRELAGRRSNPRQLAARTERKAIGEPHKPA